MRFAGSEDIMGFKVGSYEMQGRPNGVINVGS